MRLVRSRGCESMDSEPDAPQADGRLRCGAQARPFATAARKRQSGMARIVLVYNTERLGVAAPVDMARIQLNETGSALARLGHEVDIATSEIALQLGRQPIVMAERLRRVCLSRVRWDEYDVVETNFHQGWETLSRYRGVTHPFIIAKLGSVVGAEDMPGIYYFGRTRDRMFTIQREIHAGARYVTLLTRAAQDLWTGLFGPRDGHLLIPGAAPSQIPSRGPDPFPPREGIRVLFSGNIYHKSQPEANRVLVQKLNTLGKHLASHGRTFFAGPGDTRRLDLRYVTNLGVVSYEASWQHMLHADVGIVVSAGSFMQNNESTKMYYYLRAGLPTVTESGFPNDHIVNESGLGFVTPSDDMEEMAYRIVQAARMRWDRAAAMRYVLGNHTWDVRAGVYDVLIRSKFPAAPVVRATSRTF